MSADIEDQIVVDVQHQFVRASSSIPPFKTEPDIEQPEAGPSNRRKTRTSDVHINGNEGLNGASQTEIPKVEVDLKEKEKPRTYIQPDHFYPTTNHPNQAGITRNIPKIGDGPLSPEDDPQALRGIPVFKPTMEEFEDFEAYATSTTAWGQYSGIVKIIPPSEWTSTLPPISKKTLSKQPIRAPIQQNIFGSSGLFRIANVPRNKNRPLSIKEWFNKCINDKKFIGIGPKDIGKTLNRDSKEAIEWRAKKNAEIRQAKEEKKRKAQEKKDKKFAAKLVEEGQNQSQDQNTMVNEEEDQHHSDPNDPSSTVPPLDPPSSTSSHSSPDPTNPATPEAESESEPVEPWYKSFNPSRDWLPKDTNQEDYTPEACAALERHLWKNLGLGEPSWYGADMEGSLFVDDKTPWNVAHLPNLLNRWDLRHLPGVNAPYLYFGMWGASFAWHVEDMDLFSINYIHFGAPKYWYAVPQLQAEKFERVLQGYFPEESRHCDQYLRHKSFAVSPHRLANDGVHVNMLVHNQGEFVITYPRGYHAGFNMGFNCAESVNFALDSWVELGRRAKACQCVTHSVHIDVDEMIAKEEKRLNGEQELLEAIAEERSNKKPRKRINTENSETSRKRIKREVEIANNDHDQSMEISEEEGEINVEPKIPIMRKKKPKSIISLSPTRPELPAAIIKENPFYPCLFCPSLSPDGLLLVYEPNEHIKNIWKPRNSITEDIKIHHQCALAMPGIGIEDKEIDGKLVTYVVGLENVEQARWNLKCAACEDKKLAKSGAKIQCTKGKCPRAYHVSCAKSSSEASLKIWEVEIPTLPAEGEEPLPEGVPIPIIRDIKVELLCPQHNPEMKAQIEAKKADNFKRKVFSLPIGSKVKIKSKGGFSIEYTLLEIREEMMDIVVQDDVGQSAIYPWTSIDFRPSGVRTENEYARVHTHTRKASDLTQAEPTPTIGSAQTVTRPRTLPSVPTQIPATVLRQEKPSTRIKLTIKQPPVQTQIPAQPQIPSAQPQISSQPQISAQPQLFTQKPSAHFAPLRMDQMLNPRNDTPSRVVLCEDPRTTTFPITAHPPAQYSQPRSQPDVHRQVPRMNDFNSQIPVLPTTRYHPTPPIHHTHNYLPHMVPYDSRDPYNRPLPPLERGFQPMPTRHAGPDIRRSSLTDQPPPLRVSNGYHFPLSSGYMAPPPHTAPPQHTVPPVRSYAAPSHQANGSYPPPPTLNGQTSFQQGFSNSTNQPISNGSTSNGVGKIDLGLQRMQTLMSHLRPLTVPAIHLAGTNGKGSVSAILESCLMTAGMDVGRYNSPHLIEPRDSIRINGQPPSRQLYNDTQQLIEHINEKFQIKATTFEISTTIAYQILNTIQPNLDIMIIECGMGGLRDATNIIPDEIKLISGLTNIGLDHTSFLGNTIYEISLEKSEIVSSSGNGDGIIVISPESNKDTLLAVKQICKKKQARYIESSISEEIQRLTSPITLKPFNKPSSRLIRTILPNSNGIEQLTNKRSIKVLETEFNLSGKHQLNNLSLSLTILDILRNEQRSINIQPKLTTITDQKLQIGVSKSDWPGRCSWINYKNTLPLLIDGSHNFDSSTSLRSYIDSLDIQISPQNLVRPKIRYIISLSSSPGKSISSIISPLLLNSQDVEVIIWEFSSPIEGMPWIKPIPSSEIAQVALEYVREKNIKFGGIGLDGLNNTLNTLIRQEEEGAEQRLNVVCGSLYGVADVYRLLIG